MHNFKWIRVVCFLALTMIFTAILNYVLIPSNTVRINLHYLKEENQYDTLFIGTSHGQYGIDPATIDQITGRTSLNLCMADAYPDDMYHLLKLALETQQPKTVVYELDPSYWMNEQRTGSTQIFFYKEFPYTPARLSYFLDKIIGLDFRSTLAPWSYYRNLYASIPANIREKSSRAYKEYDPSVLEIPQGHYGGRGFLYRNRVSGEDKGNFNHVPFEKTMLKEKPAMYMQKLVQLCKEKEIELIVITTPVPQDTINQSWEAYQAAYQYFGDLAKGYQIPYYHFNYDSPEPLDLSMTGYWDYDGHMDGIQAMAFSRVLAQVLGELPD